MTDEAIRIRDRYQFEIKLNYPLSRDKTTSTYELAWYMFIPRSLGIHRASYFKSSFYNDLQAYIRLKTPSVLLSSIAGKEDGALAKLQASTLQLAEGGSETAVGQFEYQIKIFCCILNSALRDFVTFIDETGDLEDRERLIVEYLRSVKTITADFRGLRSRIVLPSVPSEALAIYAFAEEYVSLLVERHSYALLEFLRDVEEPALRKSQRKTMDLVANEVNYRASRQFPSIPNENSNNEQLIFRRNVLKKYMGNVLFLDTSTRREGRMLEQSLFGIAAGVSMLFATAVLFISQSIYGAFTMPVFLALVLSYIFKDRIKELLRVYFARKMAGALFDHKTRIYSDAKHPIGVCRESFDFVREASLPDRIMRIRKRDRITEIESDWLCEDVMLYRKRIKLSPKAMSAFGDDIETDGIIDILRFSVADFTRRMGNPRKELFVLDQDDYRSVKAERVYHLNLVLRYGSDDTIRYQRFRIVLNQRRIKRIERVMVEND